MFRAAFVASSLFASAAALAEIPHHARGGSAWVQHQHKMAVRNDDFTTAWFDQKLDHSDDADTRTFQQRYHVQDEFYEAGTSDTVLLYIGGEGPQDTPGGGYVDVIAAEFSALSLALEHRYYGESVPFGVATAETGGGLTNENIKYLTVDNALDDLHAFSRWYEETELNGVPHKWVAIGGSYPGALSSWYKLKYPQDTVATWSSSGVVNAIYDFVEFDQAISYSIGEECAAQVSLLSQAFDDLFAQGKGDEAKKIMGAEALTGPDADFFYMVADSWSMAVQYGMKNELCDPLAGLTDPTELMTTFAGITTKVWGADFAGGCFYNTPCLQSEDFSDQWQPTNRAWRYNKCSALAYLQAAPDSNSLRSPTLTMDALTEQCATVFDGAFPDLETINQEWNERMGGAHPTYDGVQSNHTFYFDASDDPWRAASIQDSLSDDAPLLMARCDLCGHCADLHAPADTDPRELTNQRASEAALLRTWLGEAGL